jgi:Lipocalin-like domain
MCLMPNWVGTDQVRHFEVNGDELLLRTRPSEIGGATLVNDLTWRGWSSRGVTRRTPLTAAGYVSDAHEG